METKRSLNPQEFYLVRSIENKIKEFEETNLAQLNQRFQALEQERQQLLAQINQVQGAIIGGRIMIDDVLTPNGFTYEEFVELRKHVEDAEKEREEGKAGRYVVEVGGTRTEEGQEDDTTTGVDDNSGGSER